MNSHDPNASISYWPSISDMFLVLFIIALVCYIQNVKLLSSSGKEPVPNWRRKYESLQNDYNETKAKNEELTKKNEELKKRISEVEDSKTEVDRLQSEKKSLEKRLLPLNKENQELKSQIAKANKFFKNLFAKPSREGNTDANPTDNTIDIPWKRIEDLALLKDGALVTTLKGDDINFAVSGTVPIRGGTEIESPNQIADLPQLITIQKRINEEKFKGRKFTLTIIGHTDPTGIEDFNTALGLKRAKSIVKYVRGFLGENVSILSYSAGSEVPIKKQDGFTVDDDLSRRLELRLQLDQQDD